jgi:hypothetical protein
VKGYGWVWEDVPQVQTFTGWGDGTHLPIPRTFTTLSIRLQGGTTPADFHLVNLAVHIVNGLLLAGVIWPMGAEVAVIAAAAWLLHPIMTESVIYIAARADLFVVACTLGALWVSRTSVAGSLGFALLAITAKESGVMVLPLVGLYLAWLGRVTWRQGLVVGAASVVLGSLCAWYLLPRLYTWTDPSPYPWPVFVAYQVTAISRVLALLVWPVGFTIDHDWDAVTPLIAALTVSGLTGLVIVAVWQRAWTLLFALAWVFVALLPRIVVPTAIMVNEHQAVGALIGPFIAVASFLKGSHAEELRATA